MSRAAANSLIPCLIYGKVPQVDFDGWWHLFTSSQDRWYILLGEWKYEAHAPLFYLLLRFVAHTSTISLVGDICG